MSRLPTVEELAEAIASARASQAQTDEQLAVAVHEVVLAKSRAYTRRSVALTRERQRARRQAAGLAQAS